MKITYDMVKNERNIRERGLSFEEAEHFQFGTALIGPTLRNGEWRFLSLGYLHSRLHLICFKPTDDGVRVISFRKASEKEALQHGFHLRR